MTRGSFGVRASERVVESRLSEVRDFVALTKPRILLLTSFTALCGMVIGDGENGVALQAISLLAIAAGAGGAGALNMWYDRDIDKLMERTRSRPVACGTVSPMDALFFGMLLSLFAVGLLGLAGGWLAALLLAFTICFYAVFYTMILKRRTVQNIVIGGMAGAFPPLIGWLASGPPTQQSIVEPLLLVVLIFLWTPPHSWALALLRSEDYKRANLPMLPVVCGEKSTNRQILLYSLTLVPLSLAFSTLGAASWLYGVIAIVLSLRFVFYALMMNFSTTATPRATGALFGFSITYMVLMFLLRIVDHVFLYQVLPPLWW